MKIGSATNTSLMSVRWFQRDVDWLPLSNTVLDWPISKLLSNLNNNWTNLFLRLKWPICLYHLHIGSQPKSQDIYCIIKVYRTCSIAKLGDIAFGTVRPFYHTQKHIAFHQIDISTCIVQIIGNYLVMVVTQKFILEQKYLGKYFSHF